MGVVRLMGDRVVGMELMWVELALSDGGQGRRGWDGESTEIERETGWSRTRIRSW